ncbi:MAG: sigma-70 family RNA polymerase sigma factor [Bacteroidetes bacterium]|nr:sigma-70 family RNA polymerase sigma factor [Bacteroidota bacterium]
MWKTDQELLAAIAAEDSAALAEFYDRYSRMVYGALLRMLRDTDDAEDILQEVFVQVWRKASSYKPELGVPKAWLVRIAHNRAINLIRSKRSRMKQSEIALPEADSELVAPELRSSDLFEETTAGEERALLSNAMAKLPKEQSSLLDLAFLQGYSHSEIAEMLGMPLGTVKTRIRNGLLALRESLAFIRE